MSTNCTIVFLVFFCCVYVDAVQNELEARGKKKKIAILVYVADLILKKFFILKLIYAFVFWVVLHKAGYFLSWFISYMKGQKSNHHSQGHEYYVPHGHGQYDDGSYGPYRKESHNIY